MDNDFYGVVYSMNYRKQKVDASIGGSVNNYRGQHFGEVIWTGIAGSSEKGYRWYESIGTKPEFNVYTKLNYNLSPSLNAYGDLQLRNINYTIEGFDDDSRDISQHHHFLFFNPKFGINLIPNLENRLYASFSIANREPNRSNFVDADPNQPTPEYETLYDYEIGYHLSKKHFKSEINFFFMDYDNQLVLTGEINDVGAAIMTNVENSYRRGVELSVSVQSGKYFSWNGNMTLSQNKIINLNTYIDNWDYWYDPDNEVYQYENELKETDIAFSPNITCSSFLTMSPLEDLNISLQTKYVGMQYIDNTSSKDRKLDSWFVNDLIFNYYLFDKNANELRLNFMIVNLFNHLYESNAWVYRYYSEGIENSMDGYYPQAGIHLMSGLSIKF